MSQAICAYFLVRTEDLTQGKVARIMRSWDPEVEGPTDPGAPAVVSDLSIPFEYLDDWGFNSTTEKYPNQVDCIVTTPGIEVVQMLVNLSSVRDIQEHDEFLHAIVRIFDGLNALYAVIYYDLHESGETMNVREFRDVPQGLMLFSDELVKGVGRGRFEGTGARLVDTDTGIYLRFQEEYTIGIPNSCDYEGIKRVVIDSFQSVPELREEGLERTLGPVPALTHPPLDSIIPEEFPRDEEEWQRLKKKYRFKKAKLDPSYFSKEALMYARKGKYYYVPFRLREAIYNMKVIGPLNETVIKDCFEVISIYRERLDEVLSTKERTTREEKRLIELAGNGAIMADGIRDALEHYYGSQNLQVAKLHLCAAKFDTDRGWFNRDTLSNITKALKIERNLLGKDHPTYLEHCEFRDWARENSDEP
jgi:hypothetical protein